MSISEGITDVAKLFADRCDKSLVFIELMERHFWQQTDTLEKYAIQHCPLGYETFMPSDTVKAILSMSTKTAKFIRNLPDYMILQRRSGCADGVEVRYKDSVMLIDYKVVSTPRYSLGAEQWDIGQVKASSWDYYKMLSELLGLQIVLLTYCPYHSRPLLCEYVLDELLVDDKAKACSSNAAYYNTRLTEMRTFEEFMLDEYNIEADMSDFYAEAREHPVLPICHHPASVYGQVSGFNWSTTGAPH
jgi:hypothetical protein